MPLPPPCVRVVVGALGDRRTDNYLDTHRGASRRPALPHALILVDAYASVRRIETLVTTLDTGAPIKAPGCIIPPGHP